MENRILNLDQAGKIQLDLETVIGQHWLVIGMSGSGKSVAGRVICEELLDANYPMTIVDIEGQYWSLKEAHSLLVVGKSDNVDLEVRSNTGQHLANWIQDNNTSVILDVSGYDEDDEREAFIYDYLNQLWTRIRAQKRPHLIVIDEAHLVIPQNGITKQGNNSLKSLIKRIAMQGRKFGLGIMIITQRAASVDKGVITQCNLLFLLRNVFPTDLKLYAEILPKSFQEIKENFPKMGAGKVAAMVRGELITAQFRQSHTFHAGATPTLADFAATETSTPDLKTVPEELLQSLREAMGNPTKSVAVSSEVATLQAQLTAAQEHIKELEAKLIERDNVIARFKESEESHEAPEPAAQQFIDLEAGIKAAQRKAFEKKMALIKKMDIFNKSVAAYLIQNEGSKLQLSELSGHIGQASETLAKNPPTKAMNYGLLGRSAGKPALYYSTLNLFFSQFPKLDHNQLKAELLAELAKPLMRKVRVTL